MELISTVEASEVIGVTRWHLARLVREGHITPAVRGPGPRGAFLFDPATVAEFAESRRNRA